MAGGGSFSLFEIMHLFSYICPDLLLNFNMDTILPFALLCFTSFFTLTNPLGTMPVFLTMTNGLEDKERKHIVKRATIISFVILMAFTFFGQF